MCILQSICYQPSVATKKFKSHTSVHRQCGVSEQESSFSTASIGLWLTNRVNEAGKCLPTFQHHHHLSTGSILPLCAAAGRGLVSLKQLVYLPLDVWGAPVAAALGDGEPLAHGWRRWDKRLVFLPRCRVTRMDKGREKCSRFSRSCSPPSTSGDFTSDYSVRGGQPLFVV